MTMLEKSYNGSETVVEEFENNGMSEIVDHVNLRVIQEEIFKNIVDKDMLKAPHKKVVLFTLGNITAIMFGLALGVWGDSMHNILLTTTGILFMPAGILSGVILPAEIYDNFNKKVNLFSLTINKLRKKLLQQSLTDEIVSGADNLNEDWSEVSAINGDDAVKYLVRIVKDKNTGFENIETKQFKS